MTAILLAGLLTTLTSKGDVPTRIAALARAYHGTAIDAAWDETKGEFVEPKK